jgi:hypothetical protein
MTEQLGLALDRSPCPGCGSTRHDGCGYDPETVRPAMSVADALSATIRRAVEESGFDAACRRIPELIYDLRVYPTTIGLDVLDVEARTIRDDRPKRVKNR